ncbi:MAG: hypothetical protein IIY45_09870 [Firmicutes bacterium]|nr:hypothetical protein [Bacillota bacterium]
MKLRNACTIFLVAVLMLILLPATTVHVHAEPSADGCPDSDDGKHAWEDEDGPDACTIIWKCVYCGKEIAESEHSVRQWTDHAPTCTEDGYRTGTCLVCGKTIREEGDPALGHTPVTVPGKAATCTEDGLTDGSKCSVCGVILTEQTTISALGHDWGSWTVAAAATCTADGSEIRTCSRCGETETRSISKTAHTPVTVPGKAATCTEDGLTDGSKCSVCGVILTEQTVIPALGHDWGEGVVTKEPEGFTPGERTYTCRHDPSHTKTEPIEPGSNLFYSLRNLTPQINLVPLHIVEQPQGAFISHDDGEECTLSVTVEGGVSPYTYQWYYKGALFFTQVSGETVQLSNVHRFTDELRIKASSFVETKLKLAEKIRDVWNKRGVPTFSIGKDGTTAVSSVSPTVSMDLLAHAIGNSNSATYTTAAGDRTYYCVITDKTGNKVTTDKVDVRYKLYVSKQPQNVNLGTSGKAFLSCTFAGGDGEILYSWYDETGYAFSNDPTTEVTKPGEYYCLGTDKTLDMVYTNHVQAYIVDPLKVSLVSGNALLPGTGSIEIKAEISGGVPDYEVISLLKDGKKVTDYSFSGSTVTWKADEFCTYILTVTDSMGEESSLSVPIVYKQLNIKTQPEGGTFSHEKDGTLIPFPLTIEIDDPDAKEPLSYTLYKDGTQYKFSNENTISVEEPGKYYIYVEDSKGRWAESEEVIVSNQLTVRLVTSEPIQITGENTAVRLTVLIEGGNGDYDYYWDGPYLRAPGAEPEKAETRGEVTLDVKIPGIYYCMVQDYKDPVLRGTSGPIKIAYTGILPLIVEQPTNCQGQYIGDNFYASLTCRAVSGTGDDSNLVYTWQRKSDTDADWFVLTDHSSTLPLTSPDEVGIYRCEVSDGLSGPCVYSREVTVKRPLSVSVETLSIDDKNNKVTFQFHVEDAADNRTYYVYIEKYISYAISDDPDNPRARGQSYQTEFEGEMTGAELAEFVKTLEKDQVFKDYYGLTNTVPLKHRITILSPIEYAQLEFTYDHE